MPVFLRYVMDNNSAIGLTTLPWDAKVIDRTWLSAYEDWMLHLYNELIILGDGHFIHFNWLQLRFTYQKSHLHIIF